MSRPINILARAERATATFSLQQKLEFRDRVVEIADSAMLEHIHQLEDAVAEAKILNASLTREKVELGRLLAEATAALEIEQDARAQLEAEVAELRARRDVTNAPTAVASTTTTDAADPVPSAEVNAHPDEQTATSADSSSAVEAFAAKSVADEADEPETAAADREPLRLEVDAGSTVCTSEVVGDVTALAITRREEHRHLVVRQLNEREILQASIAAENEALVVANADLAEQLDSVNAHLAATRDACSALEDEKFALMQAFGDAGLMEVA